MSTYLVHGASRGGWIFVNCEIVRPMPLESTPVRFLGIGGGANGGTDGDGFPVNSTLKILGGITRFKVNDRSFHKQYQSPTRDDGVAKTLLEPS